MATTHLHAPVDPSHAPAVAPPIKTVASLAAILFAFVAFVVPTDVARVVLGIVAAGFGVVGALPPMSAKVKIRLFSWIAAALAIASLLVAVFRAVGADSQPTTQIKQGQL